MNRPYIRDAEMDKRSSSITLGKQVGKVAGRRGLRGVVIGWSAVPGDGCWWIAGCSRVKMPAAERIWSGIGLNFRSMI